MYEKQGTDVETASLTDDIELEAGGVTLPRDVFRNRFTYVFYMMKNYMLLMPLVVVVQTVLSELTLSKSNIYFYWGEYLLYFVFIQILFYWCGKKLRSVFQSEANATHFSQTVQSISPECSIEKWDVVAAKMNAFLYESGALKSPYYFYDGSVCFANFRYHFVLPYYNPDTTNTSACEDAVKSYQESLDEIWREYHDVVATPAENMNVMLPRDQFRCKFTYFCKESRTLVALGLFLIVIDAALHVFLYYTGSRLDFLKYSWFVDLEVLGFLCFSPWLHRSFKDCKMTICNRMAFLKAFMRHRNENALQRWDHIAEDMNEALSTCTENPSPYFFYDGAACNAYFKRIFSLEPKKASFLSRFKRPTGSVNPELEPYVQEVKAILEKEQL
ncbi:LAFE_0F11166g1_1 [Lachancea fermentati]|uniref:LAFE_0F11166g1_1 n=1 Tax=Lachancea fermentati TaxID=4955 RepID=A0A1G4MFD9_LACFM|nr:LAFE_0F11166g1_1 [Lachancea fermentati]